MAQYDAGFFERSFAGEDAPHPEQVPEYRPVAADRPPAEALASDGAVTGGGANVLLYGIGALLLAFLIVGAVLGIVAFKNTQNHQAAHIKELQALVADLSDVNLVKKRQQDYNRAFDYLVAISDEPGSTAFADQLGKVMSFFCDATNFDKWDNWFGGSLTTLDNLAAVEGFYSAVPGSVIVNISRHILTSEQVTFPTVTDGEPKMAVYNASLYHPVRNTAYGGFVYPGNLTADFGWYNNVFLKINGTYCINRFMLYGTGVFMYASDQSILIDKDEWHNK